MYNIRLTIHLQSCFLIRGRRIWRNPVREESIITESRIHSTKPHLQGVEYGEEPGKHCCVFVDSQQSKHPGHSQQRQQNDSRLENVPIVVRESHSKVQRVTTYLTTSTLLPFSSPFIDFLNFWLLLVLYMLLRTSTRNTTLIWWENNGEIYRV